MPSAQPRLNRVRILVLLLVATFGTGAQAATYIVSSEADSGPGSLRQGILEANSGVCGAPCWIQFEESDVPLTIEVRSALPGIVADDLRIGPANVVPAPHPPVVISGAGAGTADGLRIDGARRVSLRGLVLRGFSGHGIALQGVFDTTIRSCDFQENGRNGVLIADSRGVDIDGSVISGNQSNGVYVTRSHDVRVHNALIGRDSEEGSANHANGVHLHDVHNAIVSLNRIMNNSHTGILTTGSNTRVNLRANSFGGNGLLAIDHGGDGPTLPGGPVIESAVFNRGWLRVTGTVRSTPHSEVVIDVYEVAHPDPSDHGEGQDKFSSALIGSSVVRTDADGTASFVLYLDDADGSSRTKRVTALASPGLSSTSEFARNVSVSDDDATFIVTTVADEGPGSLRNVLEQIHERDDCAQFYPCGVVFQIQGQSVNGIYSIQPSSPLPPISTSAVWLDGSTQTEFSGDSNPLGPEVEINGALCADCNGLEVRSTPANQVYGVLIRDLVINGFSGHGVLFSGATDPYSYGFSLIAGCYIGTNADASHPVPNGRSGIRVEGGGLSVGALLGGLRFGNRPFAGNVISGNRENGLSILHGGDLTFVERNKIGSDRTGTRSLPNQQSGIVVSDDPRTPLSTLWIRGNLVAFNLDRGILSDASDTVVVILLNDIHSNGNLGIDLVHENEVSREPDLVSARAAGNETRVIYSHDVPPGGTRGRAHFYWLDFYVASFTDYSGHGEGRQWIGRDFHYGGSTEPREIVVQQNLAGKFITATTTPGWVQFDAFPSESTSQFGRSVQVTEGSCPDIAPLILTPAKNHETGDPTVSFSWTAIDGATEYRLWLMKFGDEPRIAFRGSATETTVPVARGTYDWVVEARFDPCYGTQSEHGLLRVD